MAKQTDQQTTAHDGRRRVKAHREFFSLYAGGSHAKPLIRFTRPALLAAN
jgi:hypothetical protein